MSADVSGLDEIYRKIWIDGELLDGPDALIHISAFALHYAKSVFEGIRFYETQRKELAIFRLEEHTKRFFSSAHIINLKMRYAPDEINKAIIETVVGNELKSGYIRPIAFAGPGPLGIVSKDNPTITAILVWFWGAYLGAEGMEKGIRLKTSSIPKDNASMFLKSKCSANYVMANFAKEEAISAGYDDALHLDKNGLVAEASVANVFIVKDGEVITPPLSAPILPGITRDTIIVLARDRGYKATERDFTRDELYCADECFITGTAAEVTPVVEVDDRKIGTGCVGPATKLLQKLYLDIVHGRISRYRHWLTFIE